MQLVSAASRCPVLGPPGQDCSPQTSTEDRRCAAEGSSGSLGMEADPTIFTSDVDAPVAVAGELMLQEVRTPLVSQPNWLRRRLYGDRAPRALPTSATVALGVRSCPVRDKGTWTRPDVRPKRGLSGRCCRGCTIHHASEAVATASVSSHATHISRPVGRVHHVPILATRGLRLVLLCDPAALQHARPQWQ